MQQTMQKLVEKLQVLVLSNTVESKSLCNASHCLCHLNISRNVVLLAENSLIDLPLVPITISNFIVATCLMYSKVSLVLSSMPAKLCNAKLATASLSCMNYLNG